MKGSSGNFVHTVLTDYGATDRTRGIAASGFVGLAFILIGFTL